MSGKITDYDKSKYRKTTLEEALCDADNVPLMDMEPGEGRLTEEEKRALKEAGINPSILDPLDKAAIIEFLELHWDRVQYLPTGLEMLHRFGVLPEALKGAQVQAPVVEMSDDDDDRRQLEKEKRHEEKKEADALRRAFEEEVIEEMKQRDSRVIAAEERALEALVLPAFGAVGTAATIVEIGSENAPAAVVKELAEKMRPREETARATPGVQTGKSDTF